MWKRLLSVLLSVLMLASLLCRTLSVQAQTAGTGLFDAVLSADSTLRGSTFSVTLTPKRSDIAAFVLLVEYGGAVMQANASLSGGLQNAYTYTSGEDGKYTLVFAAENGGAVSADDSITLTFRTDSETAQNSIPIHMEISDAADRNAAPLLTHAEVHDLEMLFHEPTPSDCALLSLTPPTGTLSPAFDSNITEYTLSVPFTYTALEFEAVPSEGASVRVNRKNLGAGGSTVDFRFTVTAADGKSKVIYTVSVTRRKKDAAVKTDDTDSGESASSEITDSKNSAAQSSVSILLPDSDGASDAALQAGTADIVYISSNQDASSTEEHLIIAAIVLVSVSAGMGLVVLTQRFSGKKKESDEQKHEP